MSEDSLEGVEVVYVYLALLSRIAVELTEDSDIRLPTGGRMRFSADLSVHTPIYTYGKRVFEELS